MDKGIIIASNCCYVFSFIINIIINDLCLKVAKTFVLGNQQKFFHKSYIRLLTPGTFSFPLAEPN